MLDAKSSAQGNVDLCERQIRTYVAQGRLDFGVLFNLRELRVYRRGDRGPLPELSFHLLPVWKAARGEALPTAEVERFIEFAQRFRFQELGMESRVRLIRRSTPWKQIEAGGEELAIDVEYLVDRLRSLSRLLAQDAAAQQEELDRHLRLHPAQSTPSSPSCACSRSTWPRGPIPQPFRTRSRATAAARGWPAGSGASPSCASPSWR